MSDSDRLCEANRKDILLNHMLVKVFSKLATPDGQPLPGRRVIFSLSEDVYSSDRQYMARPIKVISEADGSFEAFLWSNPNPYNPSC
ncbi:MAG: hypothetical protein F6K10_32775 [Moorea sp. SIO2B7]|nr:hypothetical protein [Moorena sp. SIO2B7]